MIFVPVLQYTLNTDQHIFFMTKGYINKKNTFILFVMTTTELPRSWWSDKSKIFRQKWYRFDKGACATLRTLNSIVEMKAIATGLTERMPTKNEQSGNVQFLVELLLAVCAQHLTDQKQYKSYYNIAES